MTTLYIGQYTPGTTSYMRANQLKTILKSLNKDTLRSSTLNPSALNSSTFKPSTFTFHTIDTHIPFHQTPRLWRSLGFRFKRGPLIKKLNRYIIDQLNQLLNPSTLKPQTPNPEPYTLNPKPQYPAPQTPNPKPFNLIWIDKAIFLTPKTTAYLSRLADKLVHFTPDPAFTFHKSHLFRQSLNLYDYAVTTKAYELKNFEQYLNADKVIYATQGFDTDLHKPLTPFEHKKAGVLFIGHHEKEREEVLQKLIDEDIAVCIAGIKWQSFADKNKTKTKFKYLGNGIYGKDYVKTLSAYQFSWGSVSKWIPELHTTRTFEIPACGTALITERNNETSSFFKDDEAIFYDSLDDMIEKIRYYQNHPQELQQLTQKGTQRVHNDGRDYESILRKVLQQIGML
ncbi:CgeB family protein [Carboxylicivirga marina]|uniref:CgeB family protein n=1 Tax=Carboxylicivirga marina TaxID=2800988 RepID=UPI002592772A|nr:glycosyltransferase [uncultured Carboxylicivirga sp.]